MAERAAAAVARNDRVVDLDDFGWIDWSRVVPRRFLPYFAAI